MNLHCVDQNFSAKIIHKPAFILTSFVASVIKERTIRIKEQPGSLLLGAISFTALGRKV